MKRILVFSIALILAGGCISVKAVKHDPPRERPVQVLRHVVLFQFNEDTPQRKVREIENAFKALPSKIDGIVDFEWGTDVSVENLSQGFTHCFFVTFKSEAARDAYLPHPAHKEFGQLLRPHLKEALVVDYWTTP